MMRVRALRESPIGPLSRPPRRLPVRFWWLVLGFVLGVLLTGVAQAMPPQLFKPEWFLPLERLAPATAQRTVLPSAPVDVSGVRYVRDGREWRLDDFLKRGQVKSLLVVHDGQIEAGKTLVLEKTASFEFQGPWLSPLDWDYAKVAAASERVWRTRWVAPSAPPSYATVCAGNCGPPWRPPRPLAGCRPARTSSAPNRPPPGARTPNWCST